MIQASATKTFDAADARRRCLAYRRRILEISQRLPAVHIAPAFSCLEIVDCIYAGLLRWTADGASPDTFVLSKGHGSLAQYVVLESLGILSAADIDAFCTASGRLGAHPDYGVPGIAAATGALGHGLSMAVGMALAERIQGRDGRVFVVLSDGEMQEGSSWEAAMMASSLGLTGVTAFIDDNDFKSLGRTSESHPSLHPLGAKLEAFGWRTANVNGHDADQIMAAENQGATDRPLAIVCRTVKGRGVTYMENVPIWHYRSPDADEYRQALAELKEIAD